MGETIIKFIYANEDKDFQKEIKSLIQTNAVISYQTRPRATHNQISVSIKTKKPAKMLAKSKKTISYFINS
jgi:hypothetical protein